MMFRGDFVKFLYCCLKKDFQAAQENVSALLKLPHKGKFLISLCLTR